VASSHDISPPKAHGLQPLRYSNPVATQGQIFFPVQIGSVGLFTLLTLTQEGSEVEGQALENALVALRLYRLLKNSAPVEGRGFKPRRERDHRRRAFLAAERRLYLARHAAQRSAGYRAREKSSPGGAIESGDRTRLFHALDPVARNRRFPHPPTRAK
jgi:hypothetical protein